MTTKEDGVTEIRPVPNIRHLRILESLSRTNSVSRTADEIGLSQPAVSLAIAKMELTVGRSLFERTHNGCYLTPVGDVVLRRVKRFLVQSDEAIGGIHQGQDTRSYAAHVTSAQIRCLLAIAANSSFSQAARAIGVSTAAIHRAARELEATLQVTLYSSSKNGLKLSDAGKELARKLSLAMCEIEATNDDIRFLEGFESGKIVIGIMPMSGAHVIGATIAELTSMLPDAQIHLITAPYDVLLSGLGSGAIDLIFGVLRRPEWAVEIEEEALFFDPYCIIGRAGHPLALQPQVGVDNLLGYGWIAPREGSPRRKQFDSMFQQSDRPPRISVETSSLSAIRSVIASSDCLALVSKHEVETEERMKMICVLHSPAHFPLMAKGITTRSGWLPTQVQKRFVSLMRLQARKALPSPA